MLTANTWIHQSKAGRFISLLAWLVVVTPSYAGDPPPVFTATVGVTAPIGPGEEKVYACAWCGKYCGGKCDHDRITPMTLNGLKGETSGETSGEVSSPSNTPNKPKKNLYCLELKRRNLSWIPDAVPTPDSMQHHYVVWNSSERMTISQVESGLSGYGHPNTATASFASVDSVGGNMIESSYSPDQYIDPWNSGMGSLPYSYPKNCCITFAYFVLDQYGISHP